MTMTTIGRILVSLLVIFVAVDFFASTLERRNDVVIDKHFNYRNNYLVMVKHHNDVITLDVNSEEYYNIKVNEVLHYNAHKGFFSKGVWKYNLNTN